MSFKILDVRVYEHESGSTRGRTPCWTFGVHVHLAEALVLVWQTHVQLPNCRVPRANTVPRPT